MSDLIQKALDAKRESKGIEFKEALDVKSAGDWCEIIKDIVAIANSGGGAIVIGVDNHGNPTSFDTKSLLEFDSADITNKIHKYTGVQFSDFEVSEEIKSGHKIAVLSIHGISIPIVFTKPGTYEIGGGKQKTAFGVGTVYFRHGAKSDPGNSEDIRGAIERQLETIRKEWIKGVRKVVTAPQGSKIVVASREVQESNAPDAFPIRLTDDPDAPAYRKINYDITHPHRMKELIMELNKKLTGKGVFNVRLVLCLRRLYKLDDKSEFCYKPTFGSLQYSNSLIEWVVTNVENNLDFLENARNECHQRRYELGLTVPQKKKRQAIS
jgi:hypothetical protein